MTTTAPLGLVLDSNMAAPSDQESLESLFFVRSKISTLFRRGSRVQDFVRGQSGNSRNGSALALRPTVFLWFRGKCPSSHFCAAGRFRIFFCLQRLLLQSAPVHASSHAALQRWHSNIILDTPDPVVTAVCPSCHCKRNCSRLRVGLRARGPCVPLCARAGLELPRCSFAGKMGFFCL